MGKPIDVILQTEVQKPLEEVAAFIMNYENDPEWIEGIESARMTTPSPFGVGSKVMRIAKFLGKQIHYETEVVDYLPQRQIVMKADKPFEMIVTYELLPIATGTKVILRNQGEASGFFSLASSFIAKAMTKNISKDLVNLKKIMESR